MFWPFWDVLAMGPGFSFQQGYGFFQHHMEIFSGDHSVSYPVGTWGSFLWGRWLDIKLTTFLHLYLRLTASIPYFFPKFGQNVFFYFSFVN
jgi:hypothetical protein